MFDNVGEVEFFLSVVVVDQGDAAIEGVGPKEIQAGIKLGAVFFDLDGGIVLAGDLQIKIGRT